MCKVRTGKLVRNLEDVRSMITALLLRQRKEYKTKKIIDQVHYYMKGSSYKINDEVLHNLVTKGIDVMGRNGKIRCRNGYYYTVEILLF
ncbi:MAG: hypothetical protein IJ062_02670 [Firmicutes bacterium]|nr:hypothetical protein [Bacillota bacterium]